MNQIFAGNYTKSNCIPTQSPPPPTAIPPIIAPTPSKPTPPTVVYPIEKFTPPITAPSAVSTSPIPTPSQPHVSGGGGNGQIWCSGPTAPGWNVSLPNGGCSPVAATTTQPTIVRLSQLPYTGNSPVDFAFSLFLFSALVLSAGYSAYLIARNQKWI